MVKQKLDRIVKSLPPDWEAMGLEPKRGGFATRCRVENGVAVNNQSIKAMAAAVKAALLSYADPKRPRRDIEEECRVLFDVKPTALERAKTVLDGATMSQIKDIFDGKLSLYKVFETCNLKYPSSGVEVPILDRQQIIEEFFKLLSFNALSRAYKVAAAEYSTDRPDQGDAEKASRLNVLWGEIEKFKK